MSDSILSEKFIYDHLDIALKVIRRFQRNFGDDLYSICLIKLYELSKIKIPERSPRGYIRQSLYYACINYVKKECAHRSHQLHLGEYDPGYTPVEKDFDPPETKLPPEPPPEEPAPLPPPRKIKASDFKNEIIVVREVDVVELVLSIFNWSDQERRIIVDFHLKRISQYSIAKALGGRYGFAHLVRRTLRLFEYRVRTTQKF